MGFPSRLFALLLAASAALPAQTADAAEFFEKKIRPIFAQQCQTCHGAELKTAGLDLSSAEGFVRGGDSGPLTAAGSPRESLLLKVVNYEERLKMPPTGKLADEEIAALTEWVAAGAHWPGAEEVEPVRPTDQAVEFTDEQQSYWAFQAARDVAPPRVSDDSWVRTPVDAFILAKLEENGLEPAPPADKETLLRRASFDLTGLPPSEREIADFLADDSPDAFAKVVDRLLESPRYGERWGRHWLDVARYADSTGNDEDHRYPYAWRYRDYVIAAFNDDMPYDRFVREQIAGDLLPAADGSAVNRRGVIATGFLALGPKAIAQQDKTKMLYDVYDEQVDVLSKAFLGLTVSCARCHDHKFDPILTRDYYSMVNFFANTRSFRDPSTHVSKLLFVPLVPDENWKAYEAEQEAIRKVKFELDNLAEIELEEYAARFVDQVGEYMSAARQVYEDGAEAAAVAESRGLDAELLSRWIEYLKPGEEVRAHLAEWDRAAPAEREAAAAKFQTMFAETHAEWTGELKKWRKQVNRPAEEITMGIPAKPRFQAGDNRFFHEVYINDKIGPLAFWSKDEQAEILSAETQARIRELEAEMADLEARAMPEPPRACAVEDKSGDELVDQRVFIRGDYGSKGDPAPKVFPAILEGLEQQPVETAGSGRLALANWIADPDNPLTARVMVNRVWHWRFGEGLVRTPSNFGKMGERPTHPELLDYLAARFIESGWSIKAMHRLTMLSSAYRMSSAVSAEAAMKDPENRRLTRFNRRRLDVEEIRDGLLAADGSIDLSMGGTMQEGFGTDGENSDSRLSVNPDDQIRRTVYLPLRRANLPALLNLFDFGDGVASQGRRAVTNVAPQALFMMNSEFVARRAAGVARQLIEAESDSSERIRRAHLRIVNRAPKPGEIDEALTYLASVKREFPDVEETDALQSYCRVLMASNAYIYVD